MAVTGSINMLGQQPGCIFKIWSTDDEEYHSLRQIIGYLGQSVLCVNDSFGMELLQTLRGFLKVLRAHKASEPATKTFA